MFMPGGRLPFLVEYESMEIPRTIHMIWLGPRPIPSASLLYMRGWERLNLGWKVNLWRGLDGLRMENKEQFDHSPVMAQKADLMRLEVVLRYGGVYVDCDVECLKGVERLLGDVGDFASRQSDGSLCNSVFGARPGSEWVQAMVREAGRRWRPAWGWRDMLWTGNQVLNDVTPAHKVRVFGAEVFNPIPLGGGRPLTSSRTHAIHHWSGSWHEELRDG